jgi:tRNA 2-thiouridine synthesizing protein D
MDLSTRTVLAPVCLRDIKVSAQERTMHFVISGTWGPTDPTRAMLPFIFAASAVQDGDTVSLMLFHDVVFMAVEGAGAKLVPVGPPNRFEEVAAHRNVTLWACRPCVDARGMLALHAGIANAVSPKSVSTLREFDGPIDMFFWAPSLVT